jgi:CMP-N,N'-diacetyllegionaminic acid synthase
MYKNNTILALITARGGSKGIPLKNIRPLAGKPLICWTIEAAHRSKYIDRLILSTDDQQIIRVAKEAKCEVPFVRPKELAEDTSSSMDVIMHALEQTQEPYDCLLLLQPTSPFRTADHIDGMIEQFFKLKAKMMVSVAKIKKHPAFLYQPHGIYLKSFFETATQLRRQDMPITYEHNGAMYLSKTDFLKKVKSFNISECAWFEMFGASNLDIDDQVDWDYAEFLLAKDEGN